ncbi:RNA-binding domain-containing protein [Microbacterium sp. Leaf203]|uniref:RNA-binding domain-containing protein n=1 Tax=Microbacterium sp. Leaf203 TaxID=1735677 RepID=UPI0007014C2D|nr:RNA-binding domain-containing protein [Microbacterium sp. Leaf203]KQM39437.1 transcriptional regulator [Microbacterium sp. Leaf203]
MTPAETSALLDQLVAGWENEVVEFKEAGEGYSTNDIGKYFSALSNEANLRGADAGWLVFGVRNTTRKIVGTPYRREFDRLQSLKMQVAESAEPSATFGEILELAHPDGRVILLKVPPAPRGIPIAWKGHYYARSGESLDSLHLSKLDEIRAQTLAADWTAVAVRSAAIEHLDPTAIARARQGFAERNASRIPAADIASWSDAKFLAKARLTRDGDITRAALLLLGADTSTHLLSPHPAQLTWKLVGQESAYQHFRLPFLLNATELASQIRNVQLRLLPPNELIYREISKYDERSILEALYNCIAHQDYTKDSRVIVTEHVDKLVFESVGEFYDGTPDDYALDERIPRKYRNPFLVEAMTELNLIDQMGYGIHRMVQDQVRRFLPLPDYDLSRSDEVRLTIPGAVIDAAYSQLLMVRTDLPLDDVLALDRVQKRLPITDEAVTRLRKAKLIEGRRPHLHVSAAVAAATERKADYIRTRAQDDAHFSQLIIDYLRQYGGASRKEIDGLLGKYLPDVLDATQQRSKVTNLLSKMRRDGRIRNAGTQQKPRWELV